MSRPGPAPRAASRLLDHRVLVIVQFGLIALSALLQVGFAGSAQRALESATAAERARADIQFWDEVLTMSCLAFAATGDARWRGRYDRSAAALDAVLGTASALLGPEAEAQVRRVASTNESLLQMEAEAIRLTVAGEGPAGVQLLSSPAYAISKSAYGTALGAYGAEIDAHAEKLRGRVKLLQGMAAAELIVAALLSGTLWVAVRQRAWRDDQRVQAARAAAARAAERAAQALLAAGVGEVRITPDGASLSSQAAALLRLDPAGGAVDTAEWRSAFSTGDGADLAALMARSPAGPFSAPIRCSDGRHLELRGVLQHGFDGPALDGVLVDVSARVEAERRHHELVEVLESTVHRRTGQLAAAMHRSRVLARSLQTWERQQAQRLAAVLHDDVQQALAAARLQVALGGDTALALSLLDHAISRVRGAAYAAAAPAPGLSLPEQLAGLREELRVHHGVRVDIALGPGLADVDPGAGQEVMAAARELLFNVRRHAGVDRAQLALDRVGSTLRLLVADRGVGFPVPLERPGLGLRLLTARAEARGGEVALRARGDGGPGAEVEVRWPLGPAPADDEGGAALGEPRLG